MTPKNSSNAEGATRIKSMPTSFQIPGTDITLVITYNAIGAISRPSSALLRTHGHKRCSDCGHVKPFTFFGKDRSTSDGLACRCRPCADVRSTAYDAEHPEGKRARTARSIARFHEKNPGYHATYDASCVGIARRLRVDHGVALATSEHFAALMLDESSTCAVCGLPTWLIRIMHRTGWKPFLGKRSPRLQLGHRVAGKNEHGFELLCGRCNGEMGVEPFCAETNARVLRNTRESWQSIAFGVALRFLHWTHKSVDDNGYGIGGNIRRSVYTAAREKRFDAMLREQVIEGRAEPGQIIPMSNILAGVKSGTTVTRVRKDA